MRQKSIGEVLRIARESRGWNFVDLQRMTKIQAKYLQALEYNDFDYIPDKDYVESFLVTYADALDLDSSVLLDAYKNNSLVVYHEEGEEEDLASELTRSYRVKKHRKQSFLPLFYLLLATALMLIFVTYVVYSRMQQGTNLLTPASSYSVSRSSSIEESSTIESSVSSSTEPSSEATSTSSTTTSSSSKATVEITGSGDALVARLSQVSYPIEVSLEAKNTTSWVSLTDSSLAGGVTLTPENPKVTTKIEEGTNSTILVLGVVKGVTITVAGQQIDTSALTSETGSITLYFEQ